MFQMVNQAIVRIRLLGNFFIDNHHFDRVYLITL